MPGRPREADASDEEEEEDVQPIPKRQRSEFGIGSVVLVKVQNFMIYTNAEFKPGPRLNLILGPNGAGKSSLVSAICLGLAGHPKLLGRADNLRDFVLRGKTKGEIEVWLKKSEGSSPQNLVKIKRTLDSNNNQSEWRINGSPANLRDVKAKIESLNVQLENLCQFMPQDRVAEFARLKPGQLLEETEKAIGDSRLYKLHQELIAQRREFKQLEVAAEAGKEEVMILERANDALKRDVDRFEQKERLEKQLLDIQKKLAWVKHDQLESKVRDDVEQLQNYRASFKKMQEKHDSMLQPRREKEDRLKAADRVAKKARQKIDAKHAAVQECNDALQMIVGSADTEASKLEGLGHAHQQWQTRVARLEREYNEAKGRLEELDSQAASTQAPDHTGEIGQLRQSKIATQAQVNESKMRVDQLRGEHAEAQDAVNASMERKRQLQNVKHQRLKSLERWFQGVGKLAAWLDNSENRAQFKGQVYGPILCEISGENELHLQYLEHHCPHNLWPRFVVQFPEDQALLLEQSVQHCGYRPIVTHWGGGQGQPVRHNFGDAATFARHGITHTLDEVFEAPSIVKLVMCAEARLDETYIGSQSTDAPGFLAQNPRITKVLTPESSFSVRTSKYNPAAKPNLVAALKPAKLLSQASNQDNTQEQLQNLDRELKSHENQVRVKKQELQAAEARLTEAQDSLRDIDDRIAHLTAQMNAAKKARKDAETKVKTKHLVWSREKAKPDPRDAEAAIKARVEEIHQEACAKMEEIAGMYEEVVELRKECAAKEVTCRELDGQIEALKVSTRTYSQTLKDTERRINQLDDLIQEDKRELKKAKKEAERLSGPMDEALETLLEGLPDGEAELQLRAGEKRDEIDAIQLTNPRAMSEFTQRRAEIAALQQRHADQWENLEIQRKQIAVKTEQWLPELRGLVQEVNAKFADCFRRIGCVGEVSLHEELEPGSQQQDFEKFAIHIRVKYRSEEGLQLLTAHRQSGGERSVATILYLISIQNVTVCPFRVVDEINQGMDPINERKCFMQLVEAASQPGTPQCFLLTPKLLPNLPYSEDTTLMEIFNGALIKDVAVKFDKAAILGNMQPLPTAAAS